MIYHYPVRANIPTLLSPTLTEDHLAVIWQKLEEEGRSGWLFYDGFTRTERDFIDFMTDPNVYSYAVYSPDDGGITPLALYWLNNPIGNATMMHFAYLTAGQAERYRIGIETCNFLLRSGGISALIGITPKPFRHAWRFALSVGFVKMGILPKACTLLGPGGRRVVDAVVTLCTPETLKPIE